MSNARFRLWGPSGSGKTCVACTSRGRLAVIDRDNQMFIYANNPRFKDLFSPFATMLEDFDGTGPDGEPLVKGKLAIWVVTNPVATTREKTAEFVRKSGIGKGDTLVDDPFSRLWELSLDAGDIAFGQKGMKIDFFALKRPTKRAMNLYRYAAHDMCWTAHQKAEWDKGKNAPTGNVLAIGESSTETDIMWEFRMEMGADGPRMVCMKEKGGLFKLGEVFHRPIIRDLFAERGLYQMMDGFRESVTEELDEEKAEGLFEAGNPATTAFDLFKANMRAAAKAKALAAFRDDPGNKRLAGTFTPKQLAEVKALVEELAK